MSDEAKKIDDGGPAFPMPSGDEPRVNQTTHYNEGMSLRDWFAGQALAPFITWNGNEKFPANHELIAESCYRLADAMLKARKQ